MYASVFGTSDELNKNIPNTQVLINKIVNDIEIGNEPYGGYGAKANFVYHDNNFKFGWNFSQLVFWERCFAFHFFFYRDCYKPKFESQGVNLKTGFFY